MSRPVCFLDASAVTRLVVAETESAALVARLAGCRLVGSGLLVPEVTRSVRCVHGNRHDALLSQVLSRIDLVAVDRAVLADAADLAPAPLQTLDAVHLASALLLGGRLDTFVRLRRPAAHRRPGRRPAGGAAGTLRSVPRTKKVHADRRRDQPSRSSSAKDTATGRCTATTSWNRCTNR